MAAQSPELVNFPGRFISSASLLRVNSIPQARSLTMWLNSSGLGSGLRVHHWDWVEVEFCATFSQMFELSISASLLSTSLPDY